MKRTTPKLLIIALLALTLIPFGQDLRASNVSHEGLYYGTSREFVYQENGLTNPGFSHYSGTLFWDLGRGQNWEMTSTHHFSKSVFSYNFITSGSSSAVSDTYQNLRSEASAQAEVIFRQGLYFGFAFMVILLNLVCFFLFEERVFLYYFLALTGITAALIFSDGLFTLFGMEQALNPKAIQATLLLVAMGCSALFASAYLNLHEFFPKLKWIALVQFTVAGLLTIAAWFTSEAIFAHLSNLVVFGMMSCYFLSGVMLFSRKNYAKFYVIAYAIPLLFAIDFFVLRNLGIEFLFTEAIHVKAAALVEMLVMTYAIVYRMQAIKEENILRQTEMRIFLKQQEALTSRQKTEKLIEDVYLENLIMHYDLDGFEIKLLQYISEGKDNTKIARKLKVTETDIEEMTKELYHKLEISEHIKEDYRIVESQPDYIYN